MDIIKVWPRLMGDGTPALVRMPERAWAPLPADGATVPFDEYWARRLRDGDVLDAAPKPEPDEPEAEGAAPAERPASTPKLAPAPKAAPSQTKEP